MVSRRLREARVWSRYFTSHGNKRDTAACSPSFSAHPVGWGGRKVDAKFYTKSSRCWPGCEPVPGKSEYEEGSCRKKPASRNSGKNVSRETARKKQFARGGKRAQQAKEQVSECSGTPQRQQAQEGSLTEEAVAYRVERFFFAGFEAGAVFRVFSFFSRLNFQAVRNAPASRSSFAASRRT